jgi:hypothetical protein
MSATTTSGTPQPTAFSTRLRNAAVGAVFALVLIVPKLLHLRRNKHSWLAFRITLAIVGAALVILPLSIWNSLLAAIVGLAMFLAAILLPPAKTVNLPSDKAKELGALVIVNGGEYQPAKASPVAAQLVVGSENIWALDPKLQPLLVISTSKISSVSVAEARGHWILSIRTMDHTADFLYRGVFAQHLAQVAESTICSVMRPTLPVLPQKHAARA